jgi:hypothetical protein
LALNVRNQITIKGEIDIGLLEEITHFLPLLGRVVLGCMLLFHFSVVAEEGKRVFMNSQTGLLNTHELN